MVSSLECIPQDASLEIQQRIPHIGATPEIAIAQPKGYWIGEGEGIRWVTAERIEWETSISVGNMRFAASPIQ